jgi:ribonuclease P protein component
MRVGFTVTKKIGGAVVRNRMKRRFRALAREIIAAKGISGSDHVMIGRAKGVERDFSLLRSELADDPDYPGMAERPVASASAKLSLPAELLGLCDYRNRTLWSRARRLDGLEAHLPLPPLGRPGLRPGTVRISTK